MTSSMMDASRAQAQQLEQDASRYSEERGEILLEAAELWQRAGERERAVALLSEVLALGGVESGYARFRWADVCFEQGAEEDTWAHLAVLEQTESSGSGPAELVAELLEERGAYWGSTRPEVKCCLNRLEGALCRLPWEYRRCLWADSTVVFPGADSRCLASVLWVARSHLPAARRH